jgi:hypothetical protein
VPSAPMGTLAVSGLVPDVYFIAHGGRRYGK